MRGLAAFVSKTGGDQVVRTPASTNIDPGSSGTYQIAVGIERVQKARLIRAGIRLNAPDVSFEPRHSPCRHTYAGGLRFPVLIQRRQALFGLAALCAFGDVLDGAVDVAADPIVRHHAASLAPPVPSYLCPGARYSNL